MYISELLNIPRFGRNPVILDTLQFTLILGSTHLRLRQLSCLPCRLVKCGRARKIINYSMSLIKALFDLTESSLRFAGKSNVQRI